MELVGFERRAITTSASIGIATGSRTSAGELLHDADVVLYRAKAAGKGCAVRFEPYTQAEVSARVELEGDLRAGLGEEFVLDYQPTFDLTSLEIIGVEALLRWVHPRRGRVMPGDFTPVLEERT